jgi:hypothetical protein
LQEAQCEAGKSSDSLLGRRSMQTLRKLATTIPSTPKTAVNNISILVYILDVFAYRVNSWEYFYLALGYRSYGGLLNAY